MYIFLTIIMSYLLGSIPNALIIGEKFFNKDVRKFGSGNLGGSNTGRVCNKKSGFLVMSLDACKAALAVLLTKLIISETNPDFVQYSIYISGFFAIVGHCYTCFSHFKGGKGFAAFTGFLFITNAYLFSISILTYLVLLKITKTVSLSTMIILIFSFLLSFVPIFHHSHILDIDFNLFYSLTILLCAIVITYRHRSNIKRLKEGTETKITWMK